MGSQVIRNQHRQSTISFIQVAIDIETNEMIKKRFGEDFANKINNNLEVKANEVIKRDVRGGKQRRNNRGDRERKPKEPKPEKKEEKAAEEAPK